MATALHGKKGYLVLTGETIALVTNFRVKETVSSYETTALSPTNPTHESHDFDGLIAVEGSVEALADADATPVALGLKLQAVFYASASRSFAGSIGILSLDHGVNRKDVQTYSMDFKGSGTFTRA